MRIDNIFSKKIVVKFLVFLAFITQTSALAAPQDLSFAAPVYYQVGSSPYNLKIGDFNGDTKLDLVVANRDSNSISVLLGKGDGTFYSQTTYATGGGPLSVTIGDFNGDGTPDLATANLTSNNISVLLGKDNGTFNSATSYSAGDEPSSITSGDFNGDQKLDLALSNLGSNNVSVLLGKGDGTFNPQVKYSTGVQPTSIATADFNLDGILDLAVGINNTGQSKAALLIGKGDGTFYAPINSQVGGNPRLSTGDFNGDLIPDLAVVNGLDNNLSVLIGKGDGTFNPQVIYPVGSQPNSVACGDFDGDDIPDLVIPNKGSGYISLLSGKGDGTFYPQVIYAAGSQPFGVTLGDFNGDGKQDIAVLDIINSRAAVFINNNSVPVNLPPVLASLGNQTIDQGKTLELVIRASDPNNDPLIFEATNLPTGATFDPTTQIFSWTPGYTQSGDYSVRFKVSDGNLSASQDVTISVTKVNLPPVITIHGNQNINEGQLLNFTVSATDPNGDVLTFATTNLPTGAAFNTDTLAFSWTPYYNQAGLYTVNFQVSDGNLTVSRDVVITVNQVNLPPEMASIGNQTVDEGKPLQFTVSATDPDGDILTYSATGMPEGAIFDSVTQTFSWTPDYNQAGLYTVNFQVSDGNLTVSRSVFINVNQVNLPPEIALIGNQIVDEGKTLQFTVSAIDPDGDILTYTATGMPEGAILNSTSKTFSWTPGYTQAGSFTVRIHVSDGSLTVSQDVLINVNQVNLSPELATIANQTVDEGKLLQFTISATDPDGDNLAYAATGMPEGANIDPATHNFSWTPNYTQAGAYTVNFQVSDGSLTVSQDVFITVNQVNLPPEITSIGDQTVDEGQSLQFILNASDPDGDKLTYSATGVPEGAKFDPATQTFNWAPNYKQAGTYTVNFQVSDGSLTVSKDVIITVNQVNLPPEITSIGNQTVDEGQSLQLILIASDPDGDNLTYSATGVPEGAEFDPATQTFNWIPNYNRAGSYTVTFRVSDGSLTVSRDVVITVKQVNLLPEMVSIGNQTVNEGQSLQFTVSAADPDGNILTYSATGVPEGASFDPTTQTFSWTPNYNQAGTFTVNFQVSDGSLTVSQDVLINVTQVNLPPKLTVIGDQSVDEGELLQFTVKAIDPDGDTLTYTATGVPEGAEFNPGTQTFSWTPKQGQTGSYEVNFEVTDGILKSDLVVSITVNLKTNEETRIHALIQRLIRLIEESKLSKHVKSKLIHQLKMLADSKLTKWEINKIKAIIYGIKGQVGKKGSDEIRDIIEDILKEIDRLFDRKDHRPDRNHHDRDQKPDKDDHHEKDDKPGKDDHHEKDGKSDNKNHQGRSDGQDEKRNH